MVASIDLSQQCVMAKLYSFEQISIPNTFPNILKTYAKASIKTQPYDILRWSSAYFRSLAEGSPPSEKLRLEKICDQKGITKGYLRILVQQVGKTFIVNRCVLQMHWRHLCLGPDELLNFLSICGMCRCSELHWLKLLTVMALSLNSTLQSTMIMLCEILTDDFEGSCARIPFWIFKICYKYAINFNFLQQEQYIDEEAFNTHLPGIVSSSFLANEILSKCDKKLSKVYNTPVESSLSEKVSKLTEQKFLNQDLSKSLLGRSDKFDVFMLAIHSECPASNNFNYYLKYQHGSEKRQQIDKILALNHKQKIMNIVKNSQKFIHQECLKFLYGVGFQEKELNRFLFKKCSYDLNESFKNSAEEGCMIDSIQKQLKSEYTQSTPHDKESEVSKSIKGGIQIKNTSTMQKQQINANFEPSINVSEKTAQEFLFYLRFRARSQCGFIMSKNFTEDGCPNMTDL